MDKVLKRVINVIIPNKTINIFIIINISIGIIGGVLFYLFLNSMDKDLVINQVTLFFNKINDGSFNELLSFKNEILLNLLYVVTIVILSFSLIGIPFLVFLIFFKGFILSFTISSIIGVLGIKGLVAVFIYVFFGQVLNIFAMFLISVYSLLFSINIITSLFKKKKETYNFKKELIKLSIIILITVSGVVIASLLTSFVAPFLIKLCINLFV